MQTSNSLKIRFFFFHSFLSIFLLFLPLIYLRFMLITRSFLISIHYVKITGWIPNQSKSNWNHFLWFFFVRHFHRISVRTIYYKFLNCNWMFCFNVRLFLLHIFHKYEIIIIIRCINRVEHKHASSLKRSICLSKFFLMKIITEIENKMRISVGEIKRKKKSKIFKENKNWNWLHNTDFVLCIEN